MKRVAVGWLFVATAALTLAADQVTKVAIEGALAERATIRLIGQVVRLSRARNTGAVFGLFPGSVGHLAVISVVICLVIAAFAMRAFGRSRLMTVALALTLGGALGNLVDRAWLGYVRDFLAIGFWPAFNVADAAITVGVALVIVQFIVEGGKRKQPAA